MNRVLIAKFLTVVVLPALLVLAAAALAGELIQRLPYETALAKAETPKPPDNLTQLRIDAATLIWFGTAFVFVGSVVVSWYYYYHFIFFAEYDEENRRKKSRKGHIFYKFATFFAVTFTSISILVIAQLWPTNSYIHGKAIYDLLKNEYFRILSIFGYFIGISGVIHISLAFYHAKGKDIRIVYYTGSAQLFIGIFLMANWIRWPSIFLSDANETLRSSLNQIFIAVTSFWGLILVFLLISTFIIRRFIESLESPGAGQIVLNRDLRSIGYGLAPILAEPIARLMMTGTLKLGG